MVPGGGLCATAADLVRFAVALENGTLLKPQTRREMLTSQKTRDGKRTAYGLGWTVTTGRQGRKEIFHRGDQQRVTTLLYTQPDRGLAIAVFANLEGIGTPIFTLARQIADSVDR